MAGAFGKIVGAFVNIAGDFISWGLTTIWNLLEIIFDVVKPGPHGLHQEARAALNDHQEPDRRSSATWSAPASSAFRTSPPTFASTSRPG